MIIKQLSVFLENKTGRLYAAAETLSNNGINIRALSLADTSEFGILRLIVDKPEEGKKYLSEEGITVNVTDVVAVTIPDAPGGTLSALKVLKDNDIGVEYLYACVGKSHGKAAMVMQVTDIEKADKVLNDSGYGNFDKSDFYFE